MRDRRRLRRAPPSRDRSCAGQSSAAAAAGSCEMPSVLRESVHPTSARRADATSRAHRRPSIRPRPGSVSAARRDGVRHPATRAGGRAAGDGAARGVRTTPTVAVACDELDAGGAASPDAAAFERRRDHYARPIERPRARLASVRRRRWILWRRRRRLSGCRGGRSRSRQVRPRSVQPAPSRSTARPSGRERPVESAAGRR